MISCSNLIIVFEFNVNKKQIFILFTLCHAFTYLLNIAIYELMFFFQYTGRVSNDTRTTRGLVQRTEGADNVIVYKYCKFILLAVKTFFKRIRNKIIN